MTTATNTLEETLTLDVCDRRLLVLTLLMKRIQKQEGTILAREEIQFKIDYWLDQRATLMPTLNNEGSGG